MGKHRKRNRKPQKKFPIYTFVYWKILFSRLRTKRKRWLEAKRRKYRIFPPDDGPTYIRKGKVSISDVIPLIYEQTHAEFHGEDLRLTGARLKCFKRHSKKKKGEIVVRCKRCGTKAMFFAVEKHRRQYDSKFHLNLYAHNEHGSELMMTVDHIIPKSKNGSNGIRNLQPMCSKCNNRKADTMPQGDHGGITKQQQEERRKREKKNKDYNRVLEETFEAKLKSLRDDGNSGHGE